MTALSGVRERLREAEKKEKVSGAEVERLRSEVAIQAQLRREAEEKPEVPPPIFNLFSTGKEKLPAPAPKRVDVGINMEEVAEPVEEEKMERVGPDAMVGAVPAAPAGGRRQTYRAWRWRSEEP